MDADATYPVPAIKEMVELLDDHDLVRGVRESEPESMPVVNRLGNWLFNKLLAISHGLEGSDHLSGLYAIRRSAAVQLGTEARGFDIETEIGIKAHARGLREATIPISYLPRVGEKKLSPWKDGLRILGRVIVLLLIYNPTLTFIVPGLVLMAITVTGAILLSSGPVHPLLPGARQEQLHRRRPRRAGRLPADHLRRRRRALRGRGRQAAAMVAAAGDLGPLPARRRARRTLLMIGSHREADSAHDPVGGEQPVHRHAAALVLSTSFLVLGLQMLSAVLFISIFSGRISRLAEEGSTRWSRS